jgi:predicted esterase YcpF (UPF0227 family)
MNPKPLNSIRLKPKTIILLHGFNSAPGKKAEEITAFLEEQNLLDEYELIAPQLSYVPQKAIREVNRLINQYKSGRVYVIGTSLGGFYANYFRAKFYDEEKVVVHAINPSWNPSSSLLRALNQELENYKTNEKWVFTTEYLAQLIDFESFISCNLKKYSGKNYFVHLANSDELLVFHDMLDFFNEHQVPHQLYHYDTDHRFGEIRKVLHLVNTIIYD